MSFCHLWQFGYFFLAGYGSSKAATQRAVFYRITAQQTHLDLRFSRGSIHENYFSNTKHRSVSPELFSLAIMMAKWMGESFFWPEINYVLLEICVVIHRARTFKGLWGPGIDSKEWIPPAYVAWREGTKTLFAIPPWCLAPRDYWLTDRHQSEMSAFL